MTNKDLIKQYVNNGISIPEYQFNKLNRQDKKSYLRARILQFNQGGVILQDYEFNLLDEKEKEFYVIKKYKNERLTFSAEEEKYLPMEMLQQYIYKRIFYKMRITDFDYSLVEHTHLQLKSLENLVNNRERISVNRLENSNLETLELFVNNYRNYNFDKEQFLALPNEIKTIILDRKIKSNNLSIKSFEYDFLTPEQKEIYNNFLNDNFKG